MRVGVGLLYQDKMTTPLVGACADNLQSGGEEVIEPGCSVLARSVTDPDAAGCLGPGEVGCLLRILEKDDAANSSYLATLLEVGRTCLVRGPHGDTHFYPRSALRRAAAPLPHPKATPTREEGRWSVSPARCTTPLSWRAESPHPAAPCTDTGQQRQYVKGHGLHLMLSEALDCCLHDMPQDPFTHIAQTLLTIRARKQKQMRNTTPNPAHPEEDTPSGRVALLEREVTFLRQQLAQRRLERDLEKEVSVLRQQMTRMQTPSPGPTAMAVQPPVQYARRAWQKGEEGGTHVPDGRSGEPRERPSSALSTGTPAQPRPPPRPNSAAAAPRAHIV
eukprot:Hpha_TRINITY_DN16820_c3_g2::TRINITY_DN16820_c3_g2_i1::g.151433::m.151433